MQDTVVVDLVPEAPRTGDLYLLCSDGLSGMVTDDEMLDIVGQHGDVKGAVEELVKRANAAGGEDNITVVLVAVKEEGTPYRGGPRDDPSPASGTELGGAAARGQSDRSAEADADYPGRITDVLGTNDTDPAPGR
jgi:protein phosphatase